MSKLSWSYNPKKHTIYYPKNKEKYIGKKNPICRSSWETTFCEILDKDPKVISWSSESIVIPYILEGKRHNYYPDYFVKVMLSNNTIESWIVEIKPYIQTKPPIKGRNKNRKTLMNEKITWKKNVAKWKSAKNFCDKMGYRFKIITEKQLYK